MSKKTNFSSFVKLSVGYGKMSLFSVKKTHQSYTPEVNLMYIFTQNMDIKLFLHIPSGYFSKQENAVLLTHSLNK